MPIADHIYRNCTTHDGIQKGVPDTSYADAKKVVAEIMRKSAEHARFMQSLGSGHCEAPVEKVEEYFEMKLNKEE